MSTCQKPHQWTSLKPLIGVALCASLATSLAADADPASENLPSVEMALTTLLGDAAQQWARSNSATGAHVATDTQRPPALTRVVVKRGDTVDRLLRRHLGDTAFSMSYLRQAVIRLNPSAFPTGNIHRLESGITLLVPTEQTLVALLKRDKPGAFAAPQNKNDGQGYSAAQDQTPAQRITEQKNWIRYP
jgi:Tfp pilus assembly protein FimV